MMRYILPILMLTAPAYADVAEGSIRPYFELRYSDVATPAGETLAATQTGGGLLLGYGLSFSWTLIARYGFDLTPELRSQPGTAHHVDRWTQQRHAATAGVAWAYSDQFTPVITLEGGVAWRRMTEHQRLDLRTLRPTKSLPITDDFLPVGRASAYYEWRFDDFWSVAAGPFAEYAETLGYGGQIWIAAYRYL